MKTFYYTPATYYKTNGEVDRAQEILSKFNTEDPPFTILAWEMVGSTFYGACRDNTFGNIFAVIYITRVRKKSRYNFAELFFAEDSCPLKYNKCPKRILNLLTEPYNEHAQMWRNNCNDLTNNKQITQLELNF